MPGPITSLVTMLGGAPQPTGGQLTPWLLEADRMAPAAGPNRVSSASQQGGGLVWGAGAAGGAAAAAAAAAGGYEGAGGAQAGANGFGLDFLGPAANSAMLDLRRQVRHVRFKGSTVVWSSWALSLTCPCGVWSRRAPRQAHRTLRGGGSA